MLRRERASVTGAEAVGPYTLLRVERGGLDPGMPGQFFMLEAPGRLLPRPMSLCLAPPGELGVPDRPDRPRHARALLRSSPATGWASSARSATASASTSSGRCSSAAGSASRRFRTCRRRWARPPAMLGFRSAWHAEAAALVPNAEVVLEPTYVTEVHARRPRRARLRAGADARGGAAA